MGRLLWMLAGLLGGVIVSRNAPAYSGAAAGAVILAAVVGCGVCWWAAYRGKSQAVVVAVARATAEANARADAAATALAQSEAQAAALAQVVVNVGDAGAERPQAARLLDYEPDAACAVDGLTTWNGVQGENDHGVPSPASVAAASRPRVDHG